MMMMMIILSKFEVKFSKVNQVIYSSVQISTTGPDSIMVRASASEAGGRGFDPGPRQTKDVKMVPVATLLCAQHYTAPFTRVCRLSI